LDNNGHPVPDDTPVNFHVLYAEVGVPEVIVVPTSHGTATMRLQLGRRGLLDITARSGQATNSNTLRMTVEDAGFGITEIVPTTAPTETPRPSDTPVPDTATPTPSVTPSPTPTQPPEPAPPPKVDFRAFFLMALGLVAVLFGGYRIGTLEDAQPRLGVRVALAGAIGMLIGYNYFALGLPGTATAYMWLEALAAPVSAIAFGVIGLAAGWYWFVGRSLKDTEGETTPHP
jgi:hypothetical protein